MSFCPYVALSTKKLKIIALFCTFLFIFNLLTKNMLAHVVLAIALI